MKGLATLPREITQSRRYLSQSYSVLNTCKNRHFFFLQRANCSLYDISHILFPKVIFLCKTVVNTFTTLGQRHNKDLSL